VPDLPVSIGVSGMNGWEPHDPDRSAIIAAQFAVSNATLYPEFVGTVASVETRNFFRPAKPASPGNQIYHWNNNCESYWLIGKAMGEAMINLIHSKNGGADNNNVINNNNVNDTSNDDSNNDNVNVNVNGSSSSDKTEEKSFRGTNNLYSSTIRLNKLFQINSISRKMYTLHVRVGRIERSIYC